MSDVGTVSKEVNSLSVHVALLRGINVSKGNRIAMRDLVRIFEEAGCEQVKTWVQSGNVVFSLAQDAAESLPDIVKQQVADRLDVKTWIVLRDLESMRSIVANNPFADLDAPPTSVAVAFHRTDTSPPAFAFTGDLESIPDRIETRGSETYLYLPDGFSKSKLPPKFFTRDLAETTTRNWRTVTKLLDMMEAIA
jgi:uncharacterized protein (DUF1697 family)